VPIDAPQPGQEQCPPTPIPASARLSNLKLKFFPLEATTAGKRPPNTCSNIVTIGQVIVSDLNLIGRLYPRPRHISRHPIGSSTTPTTTTTTMETFTIKTPCTSANIGPGFDVIGLALSMYLELRVTVDRSKKSSDQPLNCRITYEGEGDVPLDPESNLITRVALYVLRCHDQRSFPVETHVHVVNPIPLGRGLGSSGAAVVAGAMLGKEVGRLHHLTDERLFDFCLMIGMPDLFQSYILKSHVPPADLVRFQSVIPTT